MMLMSANLYHVQFTMYNLQCTIFSLLWMLRRVSSEREIRGSFFVVVRVLLSLVFVADSPSVLRRSSPIGSAAESTRHILHRGLRAVL